MITKFIRLENNTGAIKHWLEKSVRTVEEVKHIGNFVFDAKTSLGTIRIYTEPANEEQTKIKIMGTELL